ncbi:response regulator [Methanocella sp. MCL-LM]|uniref:response regulator n=1 Tax=Methanocella sp. MCL-LM TaxID=3412035 RepID=UPI003C774385
MNECSPACRVGIAIVEDEKELVKVYEKAFSRKGIQICFIAYDGIEAVKKYIECTPRPHAILMDYRLPIMNGIDASREILKLDPEARIIFLSADVAVRDEAISAGAYAFLKKPASLKDIVDTVKKATGAIPA